jgi:hypothetical protein
MLGLGETYFGAFALCLGLGDVFAGLLSTVPLVFGGILQLLAPKGIAAFKSVKKWVILCALLQAMAHIPLVIGGYFGKLTHPQLLLIVVVYWSAALSAGPAWNYWIGKLIAANDLRHFFATRNMFSQICALASFVGAGYFLHYLHGIGQERLGFMILFSFALLFRLVSIYFLASHDEVLTRESEESGLPTIREGLSRFIRLKGLGILVFLLLMYFGANTAGPFFSPFMLKALKLTYEEYTFLIAGIFIGKIFFSPLGGFIIKYAGPQVCLLTAATIIALTPQFWVFSQSLPYLFSLQIISGCAWATFELASTLLIFEKVEPKERIIGLTYYTMVHSVVVVAGSTIGGIFLETFGPTKEHYLTLFSISTGLRTGAVFVLLLGMSKNLLVRSPFYGNRKRVRP